MSSIRTSSSPSVNLWVLAIAALPLIVHTLSRRRGDVVEVTAVGGK